MTFETIVDHGDGTLNEVIALLCTAIPYLQMIARAEAEEYHGIAGISNKLVHHYLVHTKDYDAVEVAWIVKTFKQHQYVLYIKEYLNGGL